MMITSNIALSGIQASLARFSASASNVANSRSAASAEAAEPPFRPVSLRQSEAQGGGVTWVYERAPRPLVAEASGPTVPEVDLTDAAIEQGVQANAGMLRTACDMQSCTFERFA